MENNESIHNCKSMKYYRQYVHNNLQSSFIFPISVGKVTVSSLIDRAKASLILDSDKCHK